MPIGRERYFKADGNYSGRHRGAKALKAQREMKTYQVGTEEQREMKTYRDLQIWQKTMCLCAFVPMNLSSDF